jgi:3-hydroxybutyryl-CoA dehydratase
VSTTKGYTIEDLAPGMSARMTKEVSQADIVMFAEVSGDKNPVHLDADYAASTPFGGRIAHGMLSASLISAVIANQLPGPGTIYLDQKLSFRAPVRPGDLVETIVTVREVLAKGRVILETECRVGDTVVIVGEGTVKVGSGIAKPAKA